MATHKRAVADESRDAPAPDVVTTPPSLGFGQTDHSFTLQAIFDLKAAVTELNVSVKQMQQTVDSTKTKVSELSDLRHKIVGGMVVLGVVVTAASGVVIWGVNKLGICLPRSRSLPSSVRCKKGGLPSHRKQWQIFR
ncbi:hypothetical protein AU476_21115 [Cupriavidus sp. UYMSc13B]|nr:hypothetical protein AU476_21115 [Cupriavidus sp. UYMSc13B]